jgi:hypothetical protein
MLTVRGSYTFLTSASSTQLLKRSGYAVHFTRTSVRLFCFRLRMILEKRKAKRKRPFRFKIGQFVRISHQRQVLLVPTTSNGPMRY